MNGLSKKDLVLLSFLLFSMFFGAGNLIFPPLLGYQAGSHVPFALIGFIFSAVGLPILGVLAISKAGGFEILARRVHPSFARVFLFLIYLCIGPCLAIPRAGSLAFEMGMHPFLPTDWQQNTTALFFYSLLFFGIVLWLSHNPSKLVERFGKLLTPLLLALIGIVVLKSLFSPSGPTGVATGAYIEHPVFQGILDGYQTGDALAALAFGIVIANTLRSKGVDNDKKISRYMIISGLGAGALLMVIYLILGFLGASSASYGKADNGAQVLTYLMNHLFGAYGMVLLGAVFTIACLCVSIGLTTSCGQFFAGLFPRLSYKTCVNLLALASLGVANLGLNAILKFSVPLFGVLYPIAIVLILLALTDRLWKGNTRVYPWTAWTVAVFSLLNLVYPSMFTELPLQPQGLGWILPATVALVLALFTRPIRQRVKQSV
ncbi:branched-chain amino acid transport system II carrier protein [Tumebacillus flagellatus]|uniref:Branched-chain amino acid transport system carrier protein n=1 Tax=Tumebacillus flagellatus TaxID=1157490 RepID=A0A074LQX1_9BACL|nr:branched-chain amino acid transport system II carrier protein [Tumebacillus flagellatus]KEO83494.1 branched-chain amino acid transporter [Tumebacillus flagellatus]